MGGALHCHALTRCRQTLSCLPQKLRALHEVAEKHGDSQMCDFVGKWSTGWPPFCCRPVVSAHLCTPAALLVCSASIQPDRYPSFPQRVTSLPATESVCELLWYSNTNQVPLSFGCHCRG